MLINTAAFWHHSRFTNSAAYAIINIGEKYGKFK